MNVGEVVAILTLLISVLTVIFMIGQQSQRLNQSSKDLDNLFSNVRANDDRLTDLEKAFIRNEQRLSYIEDRIYGEDTIARVRN
ncbi:MAG: hypothetical protein NW214_08650 [Pseudanabaenaceae cyanobacterium bins.39]|nr:hypothetical protein [Pseudanabaenaceae cyanobacterium bins.39]